MQRVSTRYAKALLDLATEQGKQEPVMEDVRSLSKLFSDNRDFLLMIKSPIIKPDKKTSILKAILENKVQPVTMEFIKIVVRKGRENMLPEILQEVSNQYRSLKGIARVKVRSAAPLTDESRELIRKKLAESNIKATDIELETSVDPSLIGGFVLEYEDKLYDASVAHKLQQLGKELVDKSYVPNI